MLIQLSPLYYSFAKIKTKYPKTVQNVTGIINNNLFYNFFSLKIKKWIDWEWDKVKFNLRVWVYLIILNKK